MVNYSCKKFLPKDLTHSHRNIRYRRQTDGQTTTVPIALKTFDGKLQTEKVAKILVLN